MKIAFLFLASILTTGCLVEEPTTSETEQLAESPDDISRPVPWPGLPGGPRTEGIPQTPPPESPLPLPKEDQPDYIPQPPPWPDPRVQCDEGPHCCPDPRGCPPTLPK